MSAVRLRLIALRSLLEGRLQHIRNVVWSVAEYLFFPVLTLLATPIFLHNLGKEEYGVLALATAFMALSGPANLGMAAVTVKFVSAMRGAGNMDGAVAVVRKTLALATAAGLLVFAMVVAFADILAVYLFPNMGDPSRVALMLQLSMLMVALAQVDIVFVSAIKGCERYDVTARLEMGLKLFAVVVSLLVAWITQSAIAMLVFSLVSSIAGCVVRGYFATRLLGPSVWKMSFRVRVAGDFYGFAGWSWLQTVSSAVFLTFDRMLVGSMLGAAAIAVYSVTTQLASQAHAIPAAAMAFLFPLLSRKLGAGDGSSAKQVELYGMVVTVALVCAGGAALATLRHPLLTLWLGREFADAHSDLFLAIVSAYTVLGLSIAPYYLLMGRGDVKFLSLLNAVCGAVSLTAMLLLVKPYGLMGVIGGRALYGMVALVAIIRLLHLRRKGTIAPTAVSGGA